MKSNFLYLFVFTLLFASCQQFDEIQDIDGVKYNAEYAVPLIDTKVSIQDVLENFEENASMTIDPDGLIRFNYKGEVISQNSQDVFASINAALAFPIPVTSPHMALPFSMPDGMDLDRLDLSGGTLVYAFQNENPEPLDVTIFFPQVKKDGELMQFETTVAGDGGSGTAPFGTNAFFPDSLKGYQIVPENDSIYIDYIAVTASGEERILSNFLVQLKDITIGYAEGYLGNQLHEGGRDTIEIDFFENYLQGNIYFADPTISFNVENSFGIPTRSVIHVFEVHTVGGNTLELESQYLDGGINFPYPTMDEIGEVKTETFVFSKDNSNIDLILGSGPVAVDYDVDALTNPDSITSQIGFLTEESFYRVQVEVDLPLIGRATNFIARDTFNVSLNDYQDVKSVEFKLVTENELPMAVDIQGYFLDENGTILDSLVTSRERLIEAAPVDGEGNATQAAEKVTFVTYDGPRFQQILKATHILLNASFSTTNDGNTIVKILSTQEVNVRLGAILEVGSE